MKRLILFYILCIATLAFTLSSCNNDEELTGERIPLRRTENGYAPVITTISEKDFQDLFTTGGWRVGHEKKVNYDGTIREPDENVMDDYAGTLYADANGARVKKYVFMIDPLTPPANLVYECSYTYTSQDNSLTITSPNSKTTYQVLSINKDYMYCTRSQKQNDGSDYALRLFIFEHLEDDEIGSLLRHFRMEGL